MAGAGASHRGAVNGTLFLSFFQCDCFENMATGTHNRVFWWQVLGPPTGVPLTAPLSSRFFSVIVLRIWQQVRTIGFSGGRAALRRASLIFSVWMFSRVAQVDRVGDVQRPFSLVFSV